MKTPKRITSKASLDKILKDNKVHQFMIPLAGGSVFSRKEIHRMGEDPLQ